MCPSDQCQFKGKEWQEWQMRHPKVIVVVVESTKSCPTLLRPHGPARLLCPWNSPSKITGMCRHSFPCHSFSGDLPDPGFEPTSPAWQEESLPSEPPGKPRLLYQPEKISIIKILKNKNTSQVPTLYHMLRSS